MKYKYGTLVSFAFRTADGSMGFADEVLALDRLPTTPDGISHLRGVLMEKHQTDNVAILNIIPLSSNQKPSLYDDEDELK